MDSHRWRHLLRVKWLCLPCAKCLTSPFWLIKFKNSTKYSWAINFMHLFRWMTWAQLENIWHRSFANRTIYSSSSSWRHCLVRLLQTRWQTKIHIIFWVIRMKWPLNTWILLLKNTHRDRDSKQKNRQQQKPRHPPRIIITAQNCCSTRCFFVVLLFLKIETMTHFWSCMVNGDSRQNTGPRGSKRFCFVVDANFRLTTTTTLHLWTNNNADGCSGASYF